MPRNKLWMRLPGEGAWTDMYASYGISLEETSVSKLMTPAPNKEVVENKSDLEHGKRVDRDTGDVRKDERNINLIMYIYASSKDQFLERYGRFCRDFLDKGFLDIKTAYVPDTVYRMTYLDCTQFSEFDMELAKFTLSLNEPDPTNRGETDKWE